MNVTHESFLDDVKDHGMTIENDSGLFRSVLFKVPRSSNQYFRLVTWPGHLAISGDMGDFTFSRTDDMFDFFRGECGSINPGYWGEKLQAVSVFGGTKAFDWDLFINSLVDTLEDQNDHHERENIEATVKDLCRLIDGDEHGSIQLVREWDEYDTDLQLDSSCVSSGETWTYQYIWCLYAIVWGINKYDSRRAETMRIAMDGKTDIPLPGESTQRPVDGK